MQYPETRTDAAPDDPDEADDLAELKLQDPTLRRLQRRLQRWELHHLRHHARFLADRVEELQDRVAELCADVADAEDRAAFWREQLQEVTAQLADDLSLAVTPDGSLGVVAKPAGRPLTKAAAKPVIKTTTGAKA